MKNWIKTNRVEFIILLAILILASFLRFYRLPEYMTFLGDEGRDAIVIKEILVDHDFPLLGPVTSIGNMYLGPLYYYMMAVPMAIFWLNPAAAAGMVAVIGILTVFLIYYLGSSWFGKWSGLIAAYLYAISPVTIFYSRSSWNPNPAPFFALLSILGLYKAKKTGNFYWLVLTGVAIAFAVQMHYLALILVPILGMLWIYELTLRRRTKIESKNFYKGTILAVAAFLFLMSPLLIFDLKYDFMNFKAVSAFFTDRQTTVNVNPFNSLERASPIYVEELVSKYMTGEVQFLAIVVAILILVPLILAIYEKYKGQPLKWAYLALFLWSAIGVGGLALYKQTVYVHYLGFLNPAPYLLLGSLIYIVPRVRKWSVVSLRTFIGLMVVLVVTLTVVNFQKSPLLDPPNRQLQRTQDVAKFIIAQSRNKPFNFALLAEHNYDSAYQFYLERYGHNPLKVPENKTEQLFVVCEDAVCTPTNSPKYEIAAFGMSKVESVQEVLGVKVYKLVANPSGKP